MPRYSLRISYKIANEICQCKLSSSAAQLWERPACHSRCRHPIMNTKKPTYTRWVEQWVDLKCDTQIVSNEFGRPLVSCYYTQIFYRIVMPNYIVYPFNEQNRKRDCSVRSVVVVVVIQINEHRWPPETGDYKFFRSHDILICEILMNHFRHMHWIA